MRQIPAPPTSKRCSLKKCLHLTGPWFPFLGKGSQYLPLMVIVTHSKCSISLVHFIQASAQMSLHQRPSLTTLSKEPFLQHSQFPHCALFFIMAFTHYLFIINITICLLSVSLHLNVYSRREWILSTCLPPFPQHLRQCLAHRTIQKVFVEWKNCV